MTWIGVAPADVPAGYSIRLPETGTAVYVAGEDLPAGSRVFVRADGRLGVWRPSDDQPGPEARLIGSGDGSVMLYCRGCRSCLSPRVSDLRHALGIWREHRDRPLSDHRPFQ